MAILVTGGTGKTSIRLGRLLYQAQIPFLLASRNASKKAPEGMQTTRFDWANESTWSNPFNHKFDNGEKITGVYLISPENIDPIEPMKKFIDHAVKEHGVKRFAMMSGSTLTQDGPNVGKVWQHLEDLKVEYSILLATWFSENLSDFLYLKSIKEENKIYTACGDGLIPFISAWDIAGVAFHTLTDDKQHEKMYRILGPELLTYDQVADKLSKALDRHVEHVKVSPEERVDLLKRMNLPQETAQFLTYIETCAAKNDEKRMNDTVLKVTGNPPKSVEEVIQENLSVWE